MITSMLRLKGPLARQLRTEHGSGRRPVARLMTVITGHGNWFIITGLLLLVWPVVICSFNDDHYEQTTTPFIIGLRGPPI